MIRTLFFLLFVRPLAAFILGMNIRNVGRLPVKGPAIVISNHNSHLDAVVLMALFPLRLLKKIHPVAAADYFLSNRFVAWFSKNVIGIIPFKRKCLRENPFEKVEEALGREEIIVFFPEGSRGEPEKLSSLKNGIAHLAEKFPQVPISPIFLHGLGKALPKGDPILVPFMVDIAVGSPLPSFEERAPFMECIRDAFASLAKETGHLLEVPNVKKKPEEGEKNDLEFQSDSRKDPAKSQFGSESRKDEADQAGGNRDDEKADKRNPARRS